MALKIKRAITIVHDGQVIFECPYCGFSLVRSTIEKVSNTLAPHGGKGLAPCPKCHRESLLSLDGVDEAQDTAESEPTAT